MTEDEWIERWLAPEMLSALRGLANETDARVGTMTAGQYAIGLEAKLRDRLQRMYRDTQPKVEPKIEAPKPALKPLNGAAIPQGAKR